MTTTALATPDREPLHVRLAKGRALADDAWGRTLDALNGEGGVAPHLRAEPVPVCVQTTRARIRHDATAETGRTVEPRCICGASRRYCPGHDPADLIPYEQRVTQAMEPITPIESDDLDTRWLAEQAERDAHDEARAAYWHGDRDGDYEWGTL